MSCRNRTCYCYYDKNSHETSDDEYLSSDGETDNTRNFTKSAYYRTSASSAKAVPVATTKAGLVTATSAANCDSTKQ